MRYLLLIYSQETDEPPPDEVAAASHAAYAAFTADVKARGLLPGRRGAHARPRRATTVRVVDGETVTTDGPFAETKEALGGFYLIEARDLDEAIETAAKIPAARVRLDRGPPDLGAARPSTRWPRRPPRGAGAPRADARRSPFATARAAL